MKKINAEIFIAIAIIVLELIGGMQAYLNQLILPIIAKELNAQNAYGIIMGISTIASMAGLPIGAALINRMRLSNLLLSATAFLVFGALISALASHISIYLIGIVIRGLAGSTLSITSIGAVALGLSGRARQLTLAFSSASWVLASIIGPTYAAWVTHFLSWRWAMLLYLPFLLLARLVIALNLKTERKRNNTPFSYTALLFIILGVGITVIPTTGIIKIIILLVGLTILGRVVVLLMPTGTFTQKTPRRAALAGMFFLTGSYFAANELISLTAHDLYHAGPNSLGLILIGGGLGWAGIGVFCGMKPATTNRKYQFRVITGLGIIIITTIAITVILLTGLQLSSPNIIFLILWTIAGVGMGLTYLDTLNIFFEDPNIPDGITIEEMASSSVIVENLASTMFVPLTTSIVAMAFNPSIGFSSLPYGLAWMLVTTAAFFAFYYLRNSQPAQNK